MTELNYSNLSPQSRTKHSLSLRQIATLTVLSDWDCVAQGLRHPNTGLSGDTLQEVTQGQYPKQGFGGNIRGSSNPAELTLSCTTEKEIEDEKMTIHNNGDNDNSGWCNDDDVRQDVPPCWLIIEEKIKLNVLNRKIERVAFRSEPVSTFLQ